MAGDFAGYGDRWRYERFVATIQERAGLSLEEAERAARATLETLSERLTWGEASELATDLPEQLRTWLLEAEGEVERFHADEFVRRVAEREGVDAQTAERDVRAVFVALARLVRGPEFDDLVNRLPNDYRPLLGEALRSPFERRAGERMPLDEFVERTAQRARVDGVAAERAIDAVLQTLAERVSGGEIDDVAGALPDGLRAPLVRGRALSGEPARRMSLDEFIGRVAEREGVAHDEALRHVRAVLATLREALPEQEWSDLLAQLPRSYYEALLS